MQPTAIPDAIQPLCGQMDNKLETSLIVMAKIRFFSVKFYSFVYKKVIYILATHFGTVEASVPLTFSSCLIALYYSLKDWTYYNIFSYN